MKTALFAMSLALLGAPSAVLAQAQPAMHDQAEMQAMQQMRQLHEQTRLAMLNALSPANRNLLASVVGQLAIAPNPNFEAAASRLDAALSPNEKNAILSSEQNLRTQLRTLHEQMMARSGETQTSETQEHNRQFGPGATGARHAAKTAGHVLLMMAQGGGQMHFFVGGPPGAAR